MSEPETWLEGKKQRVVEQKRLVRNTGSQYPALEMLRISDTNFLIPVELAKIIVVLEEVGKCLGTPDNDDWKWLGDFCNMIKLHQLGAGEPDNFRAQFIEAVKAVEVAEQGKKKEVLLGF